MNPRFALLPLLSVLAIACADGGEDTTTSATSSTTSSTTSTSSAGGGGSGGAVSSTASVGGGGAGGQGGQGGAGGASGGALTPSYVSNDFYADCMPVVDADPLHGSFTVSYQNKDVASGAIVFTDVRLRMGPAGSVVDWPFTVTPDGSGTVPAGTTATVVHQKVAGSGQGSTGGPCNHCNEPLTLDVIYDDGQSFSWDAGTLGCVY